MKSGYRWFVLVVFFAFMLLYQADKLLIAPLTTPIMEEFGIDEVKMGAVFTGAIVVGAILYPVWGYLYDRYVRAKLLALASFIWGATTWLSTVAPTYPLFLASKASTGIDDSCYPGLYSLISDYFGPRVRGKVFGLVAVAQPLGYILGLATTAEGAYGWRNVFYVTGSLGILLAAVIFFGIREAPRGIAEPEMAEFTAISTYRIDRETALSLLRKRSLLLLFAQGFFGIFPWNVLTYWFFRYLETERGYTSDEATLAMSGAVLALALGLFLGGALGDLLARWTPRGRMILCASIVFLSPLGLYLTMSSPVENRTLFLALFAPTAVILPMATANVIATVHGVTPPEARSTALSIQYLIENSGSALAPLAAGFIASRSSLHVAILAICTATWLICGAFFSAAAFFVPRDAAALREVMHERAEAERKRLQTV